MSIQIIIRRAASRALFRDILEKWYRRDPKAAKEAIRYIHEVTAQDVHESGKYKENEDRVEGAVQFRFPASLFWAFRKVIPNWGDDDRDIRNLIQDFPDLMPKTMRKRIGANKK